MPLLFQAISVQQRADLRAKDRDPGQKHASYLERGSHLSLLFQIEIWLLPATCIVELATMFFSAD
jgi:hypothetical protein